MLEYDIVTENAPSRVKAWYDSSSAPNLWENQFQKKTLTTISSCLRSHRAEIDARIAKDVDMDKFRLISRLRDRESALRECVNELRVTMAYADLMVETDHRVLEDMEFQLDIVTSELMKLELSRVLGTDNLVRKIYDSRRSTKIPIRVRFGTHLSYHWRRGVVTGLSGRKIGVKVKGWPHIKHADYDNVLIDGMWMEGHLDDVNMNKFVLVTSIIVFESSCIFDR